MTDPIAQSRISRVTPNVGRHAPQRTALLNKLDLGTRPDDAFDALAQRVAETFGVDFAMVNLFDDMRHRQYFAGLGIGPADKGQSAATAGLDVAAEPGREMPFDHGWCSHVIDREDYALPLPNVCASSRYNSNPVQNKIGIMAYLGTRFTFEGAPLGTVCAVHREPHDWTRTDVALIKEFAREVTRQIERRAARLR